MVMRTQMVPLCGRFKGVAKTYNTRYRPHRSRSYEGSSNSPGVYTRLCNSPQVLRPVNSTRWVCKRRCRGRSRENKGPSGSAMLCRRAHGVGWGAM